MPQKEYKKQARLICAVIAVTVVIMIAAIVAIVISATRALPASSIMNIVTVGDYVGKTRDSIDEPNLNIDYVEVYSEFENGRIVSQSVAKGTQVERGSIVILNVSKGSSAVEIPAVANLSEDEAVKILRDNGFNTIVQYVVNQGQNDIGKVIETSPEAGNTVAFGSTVTVKVYGNLVPTSQRPTTTKQATTGNTKVTVSQTDAPTTEGGISGETTEKPEPIEQETTAPTKPDTTVATTAAPSTDKPAED